MMVSINTNRKLKAIGIFLMAVYVAYTVHEGKAEYHESTADPMQNGRSLSSSEEEWFEMDGMRLMHIQHSSNPENINNAYEQVQWAQDQQQWRQMQQQQIQNHQLQP